MSGNPDDILIDGRSLRNPLPFQRAFDFVNPVPQPGRFFKLFSGRGRIHL